MTAAAFIRQADVARVIKGAVQGGMEVGGLRVCRNGDIIILNREQASRLVDDSDALEPWEMQNA